MKRLIFLLIPVLLMIIIVFSVVRIFILQDTGKGALQVTSQPLSKVYLDDTYLGNTPLCRCETSTMLRSGNYTIRLVPLDSSLPEFQEKVTITKGVLTVVDRRFGKGAMSEGSVISLSPIADKKVSELLVVSFPDKSEILVDSEVVGNSPVVLPKVTNSDHTVKIKKDGYKDKSVRVRTPAGYRLTATIYLAIKDDAVSATTETNLTPSGPLPQISPSVSPTPTRAANAKVVILQTPNGFLRVRQSPSLTAVEITRVNTGESFTVVEEQTGWYKIALQDKTEGWISAQYAQKQ